MDPREGVSDEHFELAAFSDSLHDLASRFSCRHVGRDLAAQTPPSILASVTMLTLDCRYGGPCTRRRSVGSRPTVTR